MTVTSRVPKRIKAHLEEKLKPFHPAIERLMKDEHLPLADAVARLLWMDVEQNPRRVDPY